MRMSHNNSLPRKVEDPRRGSAGSSTLYRIFDPLQDPVPSRSARGMNDLALLAGRTPVRPSGANGGLRPSPREARFGSDDPGMGILESRSRSERGGSQQPHSASPKVLSEVEGLRGRKAERWISENSKPLGDRRQTVNSARTCVFL